MTARAPRPNPPPSTSSDAALDALAEALIPYLLPKLRAALFEAFAEETRLLTPRDTPSPRATMEACRKGGIEGARRVHRKWTFSARAWRLYVERNGVSRNPPHVANAEEDHEALEHMRRELGFSPKGARTVGGG